MQVVQTLMRGSYKLAIVFTALVAAFVMSMAAQVSAHTGIGDFFNYNNVYNHNTADYVYYQDYNSGGNCYFRTELGTFWTAAYAKAQVVNAGPTSCSVKVNLKDNNGNWYYGPTRTAPAYGYSSESSVSAAAYTTPSRVVFIVFAGGECNGQLMYRLYGSTSMIYDGHAHWCPVE